MAIQDRSQARSRSHERVTDDAIANRLAILDQEDVTRDAADLILSQTVSAKRYKKRLEDAETQLALREEALSLKVSELDDSQTQLKKDRASLKVAEQSQKMLADDLQGEKHTAKLQLINAENRFKDQELSADLVHQLAITKFKGDEALAVRSFRNNEELAIDRFKNDEATAESQLMEARKSLSQEQEIYA